MFLSSIKGTLMQISKCRYIFVFMKRWYPEKFAFLILEILELYTRKVCEMFIYKHTETMEYVKNYPTFWEKWKLYGWITQEFFRLRMPNFQDIIFIWIWIYSEVLKSTLSGLFKRVKPIFFHSFSKQISKPCL